MRWIRITAAVRGARAAGTRGQCRRFATAEDPVGIEASTNLRKGAPGKKRASRFGPEVSLEHVCTCLPLNLSLRASNELVFRDTCADF
jgi:hypothetical protein